MSATAWLLVAAWVWPLLLAWPAAYQGAGWRADGATTPIASWRSLLTMLGPIPALVAALLVPVGSRLELPWLFLGTALGLDPIAQVYLLFTSLLWLVAGIYSAFSLRGTEHAGRFSTLFLLAMAGNLWLIVGQDLFSFYAGFAMMGLASYGLVIHDASASALRAGKVYLVMALLGEVSLFAALVIIAQQTGTSEPSPEDLTQLTALPIVLALVGLGVKAGLVPLHLWLPLAHPAAPVPASAVLSGTMIKVAILGWLRFLPVGALALPDWGGVLAAGGLLTLFYALPIGLVQADPKAILAYSSISKMGLLMLMLGLVLMQPALAPVGVAAIAFYAANHALVKGGLFLGVGLRKHATVSPAIVQSLILGALIFLALALAGAPFTSGAVAKYALKPVIDGASWPWVSAALAVATVGTSLLMARFVWVSVRTGPHPEPGYLWPGIAWAVLVALVVLFPFVLGQPHSWVSNAIAVPLGVLIAGLVAIAAWRNPDWLKPLIGLIPPGDLVVLSQPLTRLMATLGHRLWAPVAVLGSRIAALAIASFEQVFSRPATDRERQLRAWPVAGGLWIGITALLIIALLSGGPLLSGTTTAERATDASGAPPASEDATAPAPAETAGEQRADTEPVGKPPQPSAPGPIASEPDADEAPSRSPTVPIRLPVRPCPRVDADAPQQAEPAEDAQAERARPDTSAGSLGPEPTEDTEAQRQPRPGSEAVPRPEPSAAPQPKGEVDSGSSEVTAPGPAPATQHTGRSPGPAAGGDRVSEASGAPETRPADAAESGGQSVTGPASADTPTSPAPQDIEPQETNTARPGPCAPPSPYVFARPGIGALELDRCAEPQASESEPLSAPEPSRRLISAVQQTLQLSGFDPGPIDGLMGARTRRAIEAFERAEGLEPTGRITFALLDQLQQDQSR